MSYASPTSLRRTSLIGMAVTAVAIDGFSVVLHSPLILPLGSLTGALLTMIFLRWGPQKAITRGAIHGVGQEISRGPAAITCAGGGILLGFFIYRLSAYPFGNICAQQTTCSVDDLLSLTMLGFFLTFIAWAWLIFPLVLWEQVRRPERPSQSA